MNERYTAVPKAIFSTELDSIATSFLKQPTISDTDGVLKRKYGLAMASTAEALLIAPRVTFRVYGENVVLGVLLRLFGLRGIEQLIDDDAINFILWNGMVAGVQSDDLIRQGISPLTYGSGFTTAAHSDPEESIELGFKWAPSLDRKIRRSLKRKVLRKTTITPKDAPRQAVEATMQAVEAGTFGDKAAPDFFVNVKSELLTIADRLFEAAVIVEQELDLHEGAATWDRMVQVASEVRSSGDVTNVVATCLREEHLPAVKDLIIKQAIKMPDILAWRKRREVREFREWLWTRPDPADSEDVLAAYRELIYKDAQSKESRITERVRLWGLSVAGAYLGDAGARAVSGVADPLGAIAGAALGLGVNTAVAGILGEGDSLLKRIIDRRPRRFATLLRDTALSRGDET